MRIVGHFVDPDPETTPAATLTIIITILYEADNDGMVITS